MAILTFRGTFFATDLNLSTQPMSPDIPNIAVVEQHVLAMTNEFRRQNGLKPVKSDKKLANAARAYARYLAKTERFSHEADGRLPAERAKNAGYRYCQVAENLALAQDSQGFKADALARQAVEGWMNSPGHRRNLLDPNVTDIGISVAKAPDKDPKYISVQLFGRPISMKYDFQISNDSPATVTYGFDGHNYDLKPNFSVSHSACHPGILSFSRIKIGSKSTTLKAEYQASDKQVYVLRSRNDGKIEITVQRRQALSKN